MRLPGKRLSPTYIEDLVGNVAFCIPSIEGGEEGRLGSYCDPDTAGGYGSSPPGNVLAELSYSNKLSTAPSRELGDGKERG